MSRIPLWFFAGCVLGLLAGFLIGCVVASA